MKRTLIIFLCAACACAYSIPMFGWGQEGHRVIAKIAYDNLTGKARKAVDKTLGKQGMVYWANWPDEIKSDTIYAESIRDGWHYQDFAGGMSDSLVLDAMVHYPAEGGNMFRALDSLAQVLKDKKGDVHTLRFFVHISSDKYCPMHLAHMDDKGGNAVRMAWFSKSNNTNLHAVWESQGYSYTEYAEKLQHEYAWMKKDIERMSEEELVLRNYHFTQSIYDYQQTWDGNTYHYIYRWHIPMEEQLYIAGIRLAKALNELYK